MCVWKMGVCYFSHPDGGEGVMHFYHLGIGGVNFFFLTPRRCLPPPPPLKFMNSPLQETPSDVMLHVDPS